MLIYLITFTYLRFFRKFGARPLFDIDGSNGGGVGDQAGGTQAVAGENIPVGA